MGQSELVVAAKGSGSSGPASFPTTVRGALAASSGVSVVFRLPELDKYAGERLTRAVLRAARVASATMAGVFGRHALLSLAFLLTACHGGYRSTVDRIDAERDAAKAASLARLKASEVCCRDLASALERAEPRPIKAQFNSVPALVNREDLVLELDGERSWFARYDIPTFDEPHELVVQPGVPIIYRPPGHARGGVLCPIVYVLDDAGRETRRFAVPRDPRRGYGRIRFVPKANERHLIVATRARLLDDVLLQIPMSEPGLIPPLFGDETDDAPTGLERINSVMCSWEGGVGVARSDFATSPTRAPRDTRSRPTGVVSDVDATFHVRVDGLDRAPTFVAAGEADAQIVVTPSAMTQTIEIASHLERDVLKLDLYTSPDGRTWTHRSTCPLPPRGRLFETLPEGTATIVLANPRVVRENDYRCE